MTVEEIDITPHFMPGQAGPLFCIHLAPRCGPVRGQILYLHPFAEEMHKSRRTVALQARRFAREGFAVLQVDLRGCGDSWGDFADATWQGWLQDAHTALSWLRERASDVPLMLWGLRLGATLAAHLSADLGHKPHHLLLWQPVINGDVFLNQFLRLKLASEMLKSGSAQADTKALRTRLGSGETIEIGGYALSSALGHTLTELRLEAAPSADYTLWFDLSKTSQLPPASLRIVRIWQAQDKAVAAEAVDGAPFWSTQEIVECCPLIDSTTTALLERWP
ncbi:MAG: hydrolase 2, exosortase A system-associated [Chromatiales bacterium]|nr:hydrolase 2, exosortase A system-associated [Chromatiales bacterium]